jgi:hypothetical protein
MQHFISNQPKSLRKLQDELRKAIPDPAAELDWLRLEDLPYVGACIKEAVRLPHGVISRNPCGACIARDKPMKYKA